MSKALYRKYRSKSLDTIIGQNHITDILSRAIKLGRISHAYLLTGPRGVGKTSVARILAHEINGIEYNEANTNLDIIEIDAASNNGVEDVRDLREKAQIAPVSAERKVYIIDEVHMLSKSAFNALLKTLEEPPEHVIFILATTNLEKLPATIISRTQRFSFRPITIDDAVKHLAFIASEEGISIDEDALKLIARRSDGSFRDSISLLDQLSSIVDKNEPITVALIEDTLGLTHGDTIKKITTSIEKKDIKSAIDSLNSALATGANAALLATQLVEQIIENAVEKPAMLKLVDELIDVNKSPQPELKLLSVIGLAASAKSPTKTAALAAPVQEISATVAELKKATPKPVTPKTTKKQEPEATKNTAKPASNLPVKPFDWETFSNYVSKNHVAINSVLSKCKHEVIDKDLILYTNNAFYKKKLDDTKYSIVLSQCLQELQFGDINIKTVPTPPPPKDSVVAAVAAIMGGGEELSAEAI